MIANRRLGIADWQIIRIIDSDQIAQFVRRSNCAKFRYIWLYLTALTVSDDLGVNLTLLM